MERMGYIQTLAHQEAVQVTRLHMYLGRAIYSVVWASHAPRKTSKNALAFSTLLIHCGSVALIRGVYHVSEGRYRTKIE